MVMLLVAGAVKQRDMAGAQVPEQQLRGRLGGVALELGEIGFAELLPVVDPTVGLLAQLVARRDVLEPQVDLRLLLGKPARPQAIDQDAHAVTLGRRVVDALEGGLVDHGQPSAGEGAPERIAAAPFSAIIMVGAAVLPEVIVGITEASITRRR